MDDLFLLEGVLMIFFPELKYFAKGEGFGDALVSFLARVEVLQE